MPQKRKRPEDTTSPDPPPPTTTVARRTTRHTPADKPVDENQKRGRGRPPALQPRPPPTARPTPPPPQVLPCAAPPEPRSAMGCNGHGHGHGNCSSAPRDKKTTVTTTPRPSDLVAPEITYHVPQAQQPHRTSSLVRPHGPSVQPPRLDKGAPRAAVSSVLAPPPRADRNIDKVVLGSICFRTWYPSYYGKEVLGDASGNARAGGSKDGAKDGGAKSSSKKDRDHQSVLERLYVCPCCFKYSKELVAWWGHVRMCERQAYVPGRKIYVHPRGRRKVLVPDEARGLGPKKRRGDGGVRYVEEVVQDEGEWSIWEVDGEKDGLFCQNLSLFAKLFLDNKSVFFDVTGFNYFLLVYTPPTKPPAEPMAVETKPPRPQITGFFSKEKMSWDNNNLACILVFPPWQRKGLGALLMGASYEISRREGVIGGPEKPISDLGKKGYRRYWAGEVARWLLGLDLEMGQGDEVLVDVNDCSRATWISPEDCLSVLREMGIVEDAGLGPGKPKSTAKEEAAADETKAGDQEQGKEQEVKIVSRLRIDKHSIRRYIAAHRISLERACDPAGFVEGYAVKLESDEVEQADEEEEPW